MRLYIPPLSLLLALTACDSSTGPNAEDIVEVRFLANPGVVVAEGAGSFGAPGTPGLVSVEGSNGTLALEGIWMIVAEFELEGPESQEGGGCPGVDGADCHEFESPPFFLALPVGEGSVSVATDGVPPGTYERFEFEIEDLDDEDEEDGEGASELLGAVRAEIESWPEEASVLVTGTFTETGGTPRSFSVFLDAEIEIERRLETPLVVDQDGTPDREAIVVVVNPGEWFRRPDGTVWDLSAFDGQVLHIEDEIEKGFGPVEVEHDD
jgi:hypothetical protein